MHVEAVRNQLSLSFSLSLCKIKIFNEQLAHETHVLIEYISQ